MIMDSHRNSLQPGYKLHWYVIKRILGQGGFGITYLAEDTNLHQEVAIKEFLPVEMAVRENDASVHPLSNEYGEHFKWGLDRFMSEAQTLARFKHPNIVRVLTVFPENNTAYMVMEYEQGKGMHELLKNKRIMSQDEVNAIILPILDGLEQVHAAGFIHRDIKPPNIFIRSDESPVLLDFGSARQSFGHQTHTLTSMVSPGFAPFEQYVSKSDKQGPWTDIYGLGATMYRAVTGRSPVDAMDRSEALLHISRDIYVKASEINPENCSSSLIAAIDHALAFKPEDRPQSISEWRQEFDSVMKHGASATNNTVDPVVTPDDSESETIALETRILPIAQEINTDNGEAVPPSFFRRLFIRLKILFKKLLKWGAIIFGILILLSILDKASKKDKEVPDNEQEPVTVTDQSTDMDSMVIEPSIDPGEDQISETDKQQLIVDQLLTGARDDISALRLTTPVGNNAVEKYRKVLSMDPGNTEAIYGLDRVADEYLQLMNNALNNSDLVHAEDYLNKVIRINPDHPGITSARERLDAARTARIQKSKENTTEKQDAVIDRPKERPQKNLVPARERRIMQDLGERLKSDPGDKQARRELKRIADKYEGTIRDAIKERDYDVAEAYVREILKIAPPKSKAYKELDKLLQNINKIKTDSGD
jgi:serine/threonine protein kinase